MPVALVTIVPSAPGGNRDGPPGLAARDGTAECAAVHCTMARRPRAVANARPTAGIRKADKRVFMQDDEIRQLTDEARLETVLQILKDILFRFEEQNGGNYSIYDVYAFLAEDLVEEGCCAACLKEAFDSVLQQAGMDTTEHRQDGDAVFH